VNASKTVAVPVERLYQAFADPDLRERWLPGAAFEVRTARGQARSQVALTHERIPDAATADRLKPWWRERVADLKRVLEA
jgi:uncharacterized protein YndB with AHSA1/START domain